DRPQIIAADFTSRSAFQEALEQRPPPAGRAASHEPCAHGGRDKQIGAGLEAPRRRKLDLSVGLDQPKTTYMKTKRNSHTTSTKCQYQAAASRPKCFCGVIWPAITRSRQTARKMVPMTTCAPWKPVAMKNEAP